MSGTAAGGQPNVTIPWTVLWSFSFSSMVPSRDYHRATADMDRGPDPDRSGPLCDGRDDARGCRRRAAPRPARAGSLRHAAADDPGFFSADAGRPAVADAPLFCGLP